MEFRLPKVVRTVPRTAVVVSIATLVILLAGCSGQNTASTTGGGSAAPQSQPSTDAGGARAAGPGGMPGVFGLIAEVDGKTLQVQSSSEQTAVSYTKKTSIEQIKSADRGDVATGWCATVVSTSRSSASPGSQPTKITAGTVSLTKPTNGSCGSGARFGGGQRPSSGSSSRPAGGTWPTARPSGAPSGFPSGRPDGLGSFASGKITKITGSGFVMDATSRGSDSSTRSVTVTLTKATKLTSQQAATASAIRHGECVRASGKTDSTGAVTANRLILSAAQNGTCTETGGFGGFRRSQGGSGSNG